jgi:hypothetical protein
MFTIDMKGDLHEFAEFGNSFRGWLIMWDFLAEKYFPQADGIGLFIKSACSSESLEPFWNLVKREDVPRHHRITLNITYDGAMIAKKDFTMVADAIDLIVSEMPDPGHWKDIALKLREASTKEVIGACFQGTTVCADAWGSEGIVYDQYSYTDKKGNYHEVTKPSRRFNIFTDKYNQYFINFSELGSDRDPDFVPKVSKTKK